MQQAPEPDKQASKLRSREAPEKLRSREAPEKLRSLELACLFKQNKQKYNKKQAFYLIVGAWV
jgi:hypothetical protein